jgi:hypothetical protein
MKEEINENNVPYFAEREEQAVLRYIHSNSLEEKNRIYNEILIEPFRKMIQSILRRYPIHIGNYDIEEVESNALTHLIEHMVKYKPFIIERRRVEPQNEKWLKMGEGYRFIYVEDARKMLESLQGNDERYEYRLFNSRAFSYCQTIIRNHYKDHSKKSYTEKKINLSFDDFVDEINEKVEYTYEMETDGQEHYEQLINAIVVKIEEKIDGDETLKKNEVVVGDAIANILKNWHLLFMEDSPDGKYNKKVTNKFAKNKILLFLKEQTGLTTKEIRIGMKPFKEIYFFEKMNLLQE